MASGFGMAGDAAGAAVVSKAILVGQTLERERTGGTREVQIFFCFFWLLMGLTWFKMVYMSSIFMGGVPKVLPTYTHRILWINLRKQIGFRKDLPRPFPCLWGGRWDQPRSHTTPPWHLPCVGSVGHWCWSWWQRCDGGRWRWHDVTRFVICQPNLWLL